MMFWFYESVTQSSGAPVFWFTGPSFRYHPGPRKGPYITSIWGPFRGPRKIRKEPPLEPPKMAYSPGRRGRKISLSSKIFPQLIFSFGFNYVSCVTMRKGSKNVYLNVSTLVKYEFMRYNTKVKQPKRSKKHETHQRQHPQIHRR